MRGFKTTATLQGDAYVVNGKKRWIKLGGVSDLLTLMVVDAQGGLSRLVLERAVCLYAPAGQETLQATASRAVVAAALLLLAQDLAKLDDLIFAFHKVGFSEQVIGNRAIVPCSL